MPSPGARTQAPGPAGGGTSARAAAPARGGAIAGAAPGRARRGGPGWAGSCSSACWRPNSDSSRGDSKQRHTDRELWFFAAAPGTLLSESGRQQRGVASRSGDGSWRLLVLRPRRKLPDTVRGQAEVDQAEVDQVGVDQVGVLELSSADYLAIRRAERHGWPPLGPPPPPLARPVDPTG